MSENWAATRWTDFEVSDLGRVRNVRTGVVLVGSVRRGFRDVCIFVVGGQQKVMSVHRLVAEAFLGPRPEATCVAHLNGDRLDNAAANLAYLTRSEIIRRALPRRRPRPRRKLQARLTDFEIAKVYVLRAQGVSCTAIAARFGITRAYASRIGNASAGRAILLPCQLGTQRAIVAGGAAHVADAARRNLGIEAPLWEDPQAPDLGSARMADPAVASSRPAKRSAAAGPRVAEEVAP